MSKKGSIKILISTLLIVISFFLGIFYQKEINKSKLEGKHYVNISVKKLKTKTNINFNTSDDNTFVIINGEKLNNGSIKIN